MFIADSEIKELSSNTSNTSPLIKPFIDTDDDKRLGPISYDLTAKEFHTTEDRKIVGLSGIALEPGESAFVSCEEIITLPDNMAAIVNVRNSKLRQGIELDAPIYFPGHRTRVFFRITNFSKDIIHFTRGERYAAIFFVPIKGDVERPYPKDATYQGELSFRGMAEYRGEYQKAMQKMESKKTEIKSLEKSIYGNVLVIMTIFVALFSLLNINFNIVKDGTGADYLFRMLVFNCGTIGSIAFLIAFASSIMREGKNNWILIGIGCLFFLVSFLVSMFM